MTGFEKLKLEDDEALTTRRCTDYGIYDVFEPTLIRTALLKEVNLGHLIFGDELWADMQGITKEECLALQDPLTLLYRTLVQSGRSAALLNRA